LPFCSNCGRDLPPGAEYCPDCGVALDSGNAQPTGPFQSSYTIEGSPPPRHPIAATEENEFGYLPPYPEQKKRYLTGRKLLAVVVIFALVIFLVGAALNNFTSPTQAPGNGPPVNSPGDPLSGAQLYDAYEANQSQADSSYTNRTIYIQDSLDFGVVQDSGTGQFYSSVHSGDVVLIWSSQSQTGKLSQGALVLAKCLVDGLQLSQGAGYLVYLEDCNVVSVQAPTTTTTTASVSVANL
jgi:hypothetical protein